MEKYSAPLILFFFAWTLSAQSMWTGNASVGTVSDFPGTSDVFRAASNSFPPGTVLQITNSRNDTTIHVTVAGRLDTPGVFILIEKEAAAIIGLPDDHVIPVQVRPMAQTVTADSGKVENIPDEPVMDTSHIPATLPNERLANNASSSPEELRNNTSVESINIEGTIEKQEPMTTDNLVVEQETSNMGPEAPNPEETIASENKIYFLTPSDFRPPPENGDVTATVTPVGMSPLSSIATLDLPGYIADDFHSYIQIGVYRNRAILEETATSLARVIPGYPLSIDMVEDINGVLYKLLIGPLLPAEVGTVLQTVRVTSLPDAFPYTP